MKETTKLTGNRPCSIIFFYLSEKHLRSTNLLQTFRVKGPKLAFNQVVMTYDVTFVIVKLCKSAHDSFSTMLFLY